ncbi:MAG: ankyrin repeat domain-containing protein [Rickettsia sp.]|nr:ankyrin repeat domain-containing protein [Rickettsia sp.]
MQRSKRMDPLLLAIEKGNFEIINLLIQERPDVNAENKKGITPLSWLFTKELSIANY